MKKLASIESFIAAVGSGICLLLIMGMTVISVFGRYVLGEDIIPGTYNIVERILFPLLIMWAIPIAHREGTFPRLEFLVAKMSIKTRTVINVFVFGIELIIMVVITWFTLKYTLTGILMNQQMNIGTQRYPVYPFLAMVPLAFGCMIIEVVRLFYVNLSKLFFTNRNDDVNCNNAISSDFK